MTEIETLILAVESRGLSGANKELDGLNTSTQKVQTNIDKVTASVQRAAATITDYATQQKAFTANIDRLPSSVSDPTAAAYNRQMNAEAAAIMTAKEKVDTAEINAEEERRNALISQRTAVRELQLEVTEAEAAQEYAKSAALQREVQIRQRALSLQQGSVITEEESLVLAERAVTAEEAKLAIQKAQSALNAQLIVEEEEKLALAKAQEQSGKVYGRGGQLTNALRNVGVDEGLAKVIGIGTVAAFALDRVIDGIGKHLDEQRITVEKESREFEKQADTWDRMARTAESMTDVIKIHESINTKIEDMKAKANERPIMGGTLQTITDGARMIAAMVLSTDNVQKTSFEAEDERQQTLIKNYEALGKIEARHADERAKKFKDIGQGSTGEQIDQLIEENVKLAQAQKQAEPYSQRWLEYQAQIEQVTKALEKAQSARERFTQEHDKLKEEFEGAQLAGTDKQDKAAEAQAKIDRIKSVLDEMIGQSVPNAADAFAAASGMTDKETASVERLALEWQKLDNVISAEHRKEGEALEKNMEKEVKVFEKWKEKQEKRKEALEEMHTEHELLTAQISGNQAIAKELTIQRDFEKEIAGLRKAGILDTETQAAAEANRNAKLAEQRSEQAKSMALERAHNEVSAAELGHSKSRIIEAKVTEARLKREEELTKSGLTPAQARKESDEEGALMERKLRKEAGIIGGPATKRNQVSEDDWNSKFGHKDRWGDIIGGGGIRGTSLDQSNIEDWGVGPTSESDWNKKFHPKTAADREPQPRLNDTVDNGETDKLRGTADTLSTAASAIGDTAKAVDEVNASLGKLATGLQGMNKRLDDLAASVTQIQKDGPG